MPWRMASAWPERPPPRDVDEDVVAARGLGQLERLAEDHLRRLATEVVLERAVG